MILIFLPLMPPALLHSSAASWMPSWVEMPKVAWLPVIEPYSPTTISPPDWDEVIAALAAGAAAGMALDEAAGAPLGAAAGAAAAGAADSAFLVSLGDSP